MHFLVVVDMQKDFIDGALGTKEAVDLVPKVVDYIKNYDGDKIIATRDTHQANYLETLEGMKLPVVHCVEGTDGWKLNNDVANALLGTKKYAGVVDKPTFGSFDLLDKIEAAACEKDEDVSQVEVCGLCTDICVLANVELIRAKWPNAIIKVNKNLTEGVTPETKEAALQTMKMTQIEIEG